MHPLIVTILGGLTVSAAVYDIRSRRIPNFLTMSGLAAGVAANAFLFQWEGLKMSLGGFAVAALIYLFLYFLHAIGAGDVKLMAAVGAVTGTQTWLRIFVITAIAGAMGALVLVVIRGRLKQTMWNVFRIVQSLFSLQRPHRRDADLDVRSSKSLRMPHAVPIACGSLIYLWLAVWDGALFR
jgi:prepilin peptidase CpaA